jgi:hypothetical protein
VLLIMTKFSERISKGAEFLSSWGGGTYRVEPVLLTKCGFRDSAYVFGRFERILTMVYVVQNYLASFGLCPSSGMWKFYKRPKRFGD